MDDNLRGEMANSDYFDISSTSVHSDQQLRCGACADTLAEPYIKCASCESRVVICLACFTQGSEFGEHESNHSYEIMANDFYLWTPSWKASDELKLLNAVKDAGLGNWQEVAHEMGIVASECEDHYMYYYINCPRIPDLRLAKQCEVVHRDTVPLLGDFQFSVKNNKLFGLVGLKIAHCGWPIVSDDPPRPAFDSQLHAEMAGYSAARGDFVSEYNHFVEMDLKDVEFLSDEGYVDKLLENLNFAMIDIYCNHLRERAHRKKIIRDYGLINAQKEALAWQRYDNSTVSKHRRIFKELMHLLPADEFNAQMESLQYESELQQKIKVLQEFRESGLTLFSGAEVYQRLKCQRMHTPSTSEGSLSDVLVQLDTVVDTASHVGGGCDYGGRCCCTSCASIERKMDCTFSSDFSSSSRYLRMCVASRRAAPPLDITGLPGYDKLTEKEQQMCSNVRFVPDAYLEFKSILLNECRRNGGTLRLAQARLLIKIDVNKTRKLYDFLIQEGLIQSNS